MPRSNPEARGGPPPPSPPLTPAASTPPQHQQQHHRHHLHNPLDAPLAGHKRSENLLTYLVLAHVALALFLAWRYWRRAGGGEEGEGPARRTRGGGLRRVPSRGPARVSAAYSFADLGSAADGTAPPPSVVIDRGSTEMGPVGMGARRVSRGALRRA